MPLATIIRILSIVCGTLVLWLTLPHLSIAEPLAIIVNPKNPVESFSLTTVARAYRGEELHWPQNGRVKLVNREISSPIRKVFYRHVLNAKPDQQFLRPGTPIAVHSLIQRSDDAVLRFVAAIEGAIGYVRLSSVNTSVKVILIITPEKE